MYSLLGPHIHSAGGPWMLDIKRWKPPVVLSIDHSDSVAEIARESPSTLIVGRMMGTNPNFNQPLDALATARAHVEATLPFAYRMGNAYTFWQCCINEPVITSADAMKRYSDYTVHLLEEMSAEGFTAAVGHFSVGTPEFDLWPHFLPALRAAKRYNSVLCVHEYDWPSLTDPARWPWWLMRHRLVHDGSAETIEKWGWPGLPADLKDLPWIISEGGVDNGVTYPQAPFRGWRTVMSAAQYQVQLDIYNDELVRDPYILGACLWDFGSGEWATAEHWPEVSSFIADHATPEYRYFDNGNNGDALRWRQITDEFIAIRRLLSLWCPQE